MSDFYFYTEIDAIASQDAEDSFGAIDESGTLSKYSVTDRPKLNKDDVKCFATSKGFIRMQEQSTGFLNVILKPLNTCHLGIKVEYIIYHGIKKSSIFKTNGDLKDATANDYCNVLWENQAEIDKQEDKLNEQPEGTTSNDVNPASTGIEFKANATGDYKLLDNERIDKLFLILKENFQPAIVQPGMYLGNFSKNDAGITMILGTQKHNFPVSMFRSSEVSISVSTTTANNKSKLMDNRSRQQILSFIDPIVYFSSVSLDGIKTKDSSGVITNLNAENFQINCVKGPNSTPNFNNWNAIYLVLRDDETLGMLDSSYYDSNITISYLDSTANSVSLNYNRNGWPVLKLIGLEGYTGTPTNTTVEVELSFNKLLNTTRSTYVYKKYSFLDNEGSFTNNNEFKEVYTPQIKIPLVLPIIQSSSSFEVVPTLSEIYLLETFNSNNYSIDYETEHEVRSVYQDKIFSFSILERLKDEVGGLYIINSNLQTIIDPSLNLIDPFFADLSYLKDDNNFYLAIVPQFCYRMKSLLYDFVLETAQVKGANFIDYIKTGTSVNKFQRVFSTNVNDDFIHVDNASFTEIQSKSNIKNLEIIAISVPDFNTLDQEVTTAQFDRELPITIRIFHDKYRRTESNMVYNSHKIGLSGYVMTDGELMQKTIKTEIKIK